MLSSHNCLCLFGTSTFVFSPSELGTKTRALHLLGKACHTELSPARNRDPKFTISTATDLMEAFTHFLLTDAVCLQSGHGLSQSLLLPEKYFLNCKL